MNKNINPTTLIARLEKAGMTIDSCEIRAKVTADDREFVSVLGQKTPPPAIDALYDRFDGFTLLWHGDLDNIAVQGSINILPYSQSTTRPALTETGAPLEGILWTEDSPEAAAAQLKEMAIFESVAGRSEFLTYRVGDEDARLFLVERDDIAALVPDFETLVGLLFQYAGAEGLRDLLIHDDWKERLAVDPALKRIGALP